MTDCKPGQKMKIQADGENAPMGTTLPSVHQTYRRFTHPAHLHRAGFSTSFLMRPGQLFRLHALPCLLFYGRQNVDPSSVSLYAAFLVVGLDFSVFLHELFVFFLLPFPYFIFQTKKRNPLVEPRPAC